MTDHRGWGLPESHLLPDAVVAFVDRELSLGAHERAAAHLARCPGCAAEVRAQRQARSAVQHAEAPSMSPGFLASLRSIPEHTDLPSSPDNLAISEDGQLVAIQRPDRVAGLRHAMPGGALGSSAPLGNSANVLGTGPRLGSSRRRTAQGAGVVVSGLVLSALALVATVGADEQPGAERNGNTPSPPAGVLRAHLGHTTAPTTTPVTTSVSTTTPVPTLTPTSAVAPMDGPR
ncbi:anti-sigma factor family protein [Prauserella cavernicola]|uniref:Zf-HC2 domain-containing protein n=1 Tax=Prauserella cavernicola TaxID=2800127 RepID=A0A934V932_9PSEU|nr:zf-HC2 domain-containing protein [Prauserella cavernicola]MBK1788905.1 zf-HC2 domain-containing protein [Prauserella cavernicola]